MWIKLGGPATAVFQRPKSGRACPSISFHRLGPSLIKGGQKVGEKNSEFFQAFPEPQLYFSRGYHKKIYVIMTFIYQGSFHINYFSCDQEQAVVLYCSNQQFSCTRYTWPHRDCLIQAAPRAQSQFSLRLHRIP